MRLTWYGTASLLLQEGETCIAIDPFCKLPVGTLSHPPKELPHADAFRQARHVLITHGHLDHIYHIPALYAGRPAMIYCTDTPKAALEKQGFPADQLCRIAPGWRKELGPFTVQALAGRHCRFDLPLIAHTFGRRDFWENPEHIGQLLKTNHRCRENGETLFYEISAAHRRLQIMGSLNLDDTTEYPTGADLLILPLQGRSDLNTYALPFVARLKPKAILLDHYDNTFPPVSSQVDTHEFVHQAKERFGIPCQPMKEGQVLML